MHHPVANFLQCICARNYEKWMRVDKVIAIKTVCSFFWPTLYISWVLSVWRQEWYPACKSTALAILMVLICLIVCLSICLSVCVSACLCVCLFVSLYMSVYIQTCYTVTLVVTTSIRNTWNVLIRLAVERVQTAVPGTSRWVISYSLPVYTLFHLDVCVTVIKVEVWTHDSSWEPTSPHLWFKF